MGLVVGAMHGQSIRSHILWRRSKPKQKTAESLFRHAIPPVDSHPQLVWCHSAFDLPNWGRYVPNSELTYAYLSFSRTARQVPHPPPKMAQQQKCQICKEPARFQSLPSSGLPSIYFCSTRCWKDNTPARISALVHLFKEAHFYVNVWHSHGPEDPAMIEGYYMGMRWARITFHMDHCIVQRAACCNDGPFRNRGRDQAGAFDLEQPGLRCGFSDDDIRHIKKIVNGVRESCISRPGA